MDTQEEFDRRAAWERAVLEANKGRCASCGGDCKLKVQMLVPEVAGGKLALSNGTVLCRPCEMAGETLQGKRRGMDRRLVNFWISRAMHKRIDEAVKTRDGFVSLGHLIRYMMAKFVTDPDRFDDLANYQEAGKPEVKVNIWADSAVYGTFKTLVQQRKMTVTEAIKALIMVFDTETMILAVGEKEKSDAI